MAELPTYTTLTDPTGHMAPGSSGPLTLTGPFTDGADVGWPFAMPWDWATYRPVVVLRNPKVSQKAVNDAKKAQKKKAAITLTVQRTTQTVHSTEGTFTLSSSIPGSGTVRGYTLEPPAHPDPQGNGTTRMPAGTYGATLLPLGYGHVHAVLLLAVPGHHGVEVHPGNYPRDTRMCILPGTTQGPNFVGNSVRAVNEMRTYINNVNSEDGGRTTINVVVKDPTQ